jgi:hypothetical protein
VYVKTHGDSPKEAIIQLGRATRILRDLCGRSAAAFATIRGRRLSRRPLPSKTRDGATAALCVRAGPAVSTSGRGDRWPLQHLTNDVYIDHSKMISDSSSRELLVRAVTFMTSCRLWLPFHRLHDVLLLFGTDDRDVIAIPCTRRLRIAPSPTAFIRIMNDVPPRRSHRYAVSVNHGRHDLFVTLQVHATLSRHKSPTQMRVYGVLCNAGRAQASICVC